MLNQKKFDTKVAERIEVFDDEQYTDVSSFRFYKRGKMVTCIAKYGNAHHLNPISAISTVGTLPSAYRPTMDIYAPMLWGGYANVTGLLVIQTDGTVGIYASSSQTDVQAHIAVSYCVA